MSGNAAHLPDASDIGLSISLFRRATPLWLVYSAKLAGENVVAWRLLPSHLRGSNDGSAVWPKLPDWVVAGDITADPTGIVPRMAAYSHKSASGWLVYPVSVKKALDKPISDRKMLADLANHLLTALDMLHGRETLHLDVHPANVSEMGGRFALNGLGVDVRKQTGAATGRNEGLARKGYGAPEMWDASGRSKLGPWTDIFAAAATLYFAICGKAPIDFRYRIGRPQWREAMAFDLNRELSKSGTAWPKMVEFIIAGLAPKIEDRPKTVSEWSRIWKEPAVLASTVMGNDTKQAVLTAAPTRKPPQRRLRLAGNWLAGFSASGVALILAINYLFNGLIQPLLWEGFAYSEFKPMMFLLVFQSIVLLSIDNLFPRLNSTMRNGVLWPAMLLQFFLLLFKFKDSAEWIGLVNVFGWLALVLSCVDRDDDFRTIFLWLAAISILVCGVLSYFEF